MQRSQGAHAPADGETMLVSGRVRATPPLLTAPISGTPCVAYFYRMYHLVIWPGDEANEEVPVYWGYASTPFVVDTSSGPVAVSAAPRLSVPRTPHRGSDAVARAREYVRAVPAEARNPRRVFAGDPVMQWMSDLPTDEDGSVRLDWKSGEEADWATVQLEELVLPPDAEVSVHGRWSARRNALAAGEQPGEGPAVALGPASALGQVAGVPPSLFGTLVTIALAAGLIWFAMEMWPQLK